MLTGKNIRRNLAVVALAAIASSSSFAQCSKAPTTGNYDKFCISTDSVDEDNCPVISMKNNGPKTSRLTIRYTHSGTTLGNSPSSESDTFTETNFKSAEARIYKINPGANCRKPNRLTIDEIKGELY